MAKNYRRFCFDNTVLLVITLLAFALRLRLLEDLSLLDDESHSLTLYIQQPVQNIFTHYTPGNHWLATAVGHLMAKVGPHRFLVRWPAVLFGTLSIPLIGLIGRWIFKNRIDSVLAALLLCTSAFHLQWSQQFRGYSALLFFASLAILLLYKSLQTHKNRYLVELCLALVLMVTSHLFGVLMLIVIATNLLGWSGLKRITQPKQTASKKWVILSLIICLIMIGGGSWFGKTYVIDLFHEPPEASLLQRIHYQRLAFASTLPQVVDFLTGISVAFTTQRNEAIALILFYGVSLAGVLLSFSRYPRNTLLLASWLFIPILSVVVAEFTIAGFFVFDRFLIFILPAWFLLATRGLTEGGRGLVTQLGAGQSSRPILWIMVIVIGGGYFIWLNSRMAQAYFTFRTAHDWRQISTHLVQHATPSDVIVCKELRSDQASHLEAEDECIRELKHRLDDLGFALPFPLKQLEAAISSDGLARYLKQRSQSGTVWLVLWGSPLPPPSTTPSYLPIASEARVRTIAFLAPNPTLIRFDRLGETLLLKSKAGPTLAANLEQILRYLTQLDTASPDRFNDLLHLAQVLAFQGKAIEAQTALYHAKTTLSPHPAALQSLTIAEQFVKASAVQPHRYPRRETTVKFGLPPTLHLHEYALPTILRRGQAHPITLRWQVLDPPDADYTVFLHLRDDKEQIVAQLDFRPFDDAFPTSQWSVGEIVEETRYWGIPEALSAGVYTLRIGLYNAETLRRLPLDIDSSGEDAALLSKIEVVP